MKKMFRKKFVGIMVVVFILLFGVKKSGAVERSTVPSSFDLRDKISIKVEDQGSRGTCWTFASLNTLETYLSLNGYGDYDFSEMHLECIENGFTQVTDDLDSSYFEDGGDFNKFINYYSSKQGPVLESDVPYYKNEIWGERYTEEDLPFLQSAKTYAYVYDYKTYRAVDDYAGDKTELRQDVKNHLMNNGAIYASICAEDIYPSKNLSAEDGIFEYVLNTDMSNMNLMVDHAITIIGWDDNYSKENFPDEIKPNSDGAYIALNSWGDYWGDKGVFYISYEDAYVEENMYGITSASLEFDKSKLTSIYIEDENVYTALKNQIDYYISDDDNRTLYLTKLQIKMVKELDLSGIEISTVKGLENFKDCGFYNFSNCGIDDLSVLDGLQDIIYGLDLTENNLTDISKIAEFSNLVNLNLSQNKNLKDLSPIAKLQSLTWLNLNDCDLTDVSELASITINNVDLDNDSLQVELNNNNITDISVLENANIQILSLSGNKNISKIGNLKNVLNLDLSDCNLEDISILSDLSELNNLTILNLNNNKIKDISILDNLDSLFECSIKSQKITDNITITDNSKDFTYNMPTIISKSKNYDKYLISIDWDENGNAIRDGEFQSVVVNGAILGDDYSYITISKKLMTGTVTLTVNGGIADGTVYTINYTSNSNNSKLSNEKEINIKDDNIEDNIYDNVDDNIDDSTIENKNGNSRESDEKVEKNKNSNNTNNNVKTGDYIAFFIVIIILAIASLIIIFIKRKNSENKV